MVWVCVRTYGNGQYMNSVYPATFKYLSKATEFAEMMNKRENLESFSEKWVAIPMYSELAAW